jgi:hypothetical protein
MDNTHVRVHTCKQIDGEGLRMEGLVTEKCRCRKFVSLAQAAEYILDGVALSVVLSVEPIEEKKICRICENDDRLKKSCDNCGKAGYVSETRLDVRRGEDIYMRPVKKTPRTATIEAKHIGYAFDTVSPGSEDGPNRAKKRIDNYHVLDRIMLVELGAELVDKATGEVLIEGTPEPPDDPKTATGRKYDWGRAI